MKHKTKQHMSSNFTMKLERVTKLKSDRKDKAVGFLMYAQQISISIQNNQHSVYITINQEIKTLLASYPLQDVEHASIANPCKGN